MGLGRDLLSEIAVSDGGHALGLLGLSPEILELGLSDDELYSVSRRFAKTLLAEVHEDRVARTPRTQALQIRFSSAMATLRSRASFLASLRQLRVRASGKRDMILRAEKSRDESRERARLAELERDEALSLVASSRMQERVSRRRVTAVERSTAAWIANADKRARTRFAGERERHFRHVDRLRSSARAADDLAKKRAAQALQLVQKAQRERNEIKATEMRLRARTRSRIARVREKERRVDARAKRLRAARGKRVG